MKSRLFLSSLYLFIMSLPSPVHAYATTGFKWDSVTAGVSASLTWGYAAEGSACRINSAHCPGGIASDVSSSTLAGGFPAFDNTLRSAFNAWENVSDLSFAFLSIPNADPDILIGGHSIDGSSNQRNILAHAITSFIPSSGFNLARKSDIHLDTSDTFGDTLFNILTHEIGHSLGLAHSSEPNSLMNASVSRRFSGPQADDIAGIQFLYGTPAAVPVPGAFWLMLSAFSALSLIPGRKKHLNSTCRVQV